MREIKRAIDHLQLVMHEEDVNIECFYLAIEALREKLEREQQPSMWVPISERKPDDDCFVYEANRGKVFHCVYGEWEATDWNVTHWMAYDDMPLPEPPREVEK